jgi:hypothetical protein
VYQPSTPTSVLLPSSFFPCALAILRSPTAHMVVISTSTASDAAHWMTMSPTGFAALTDIFVPPAGCSSQWIQNPFISNEVNSGFGYFQFEGANYQYRDYLPTDYYGRCLPYGQLTRQAYSPGVCTESQTVAAIIELQFGSNRVWRAECCDRLCPRDESLMMLMLPLLT